MPVNFRTIDIVGRALGQYRETSRNLESLSDARRKVAEEREDREFIKKENEIKLEKARREGELSGLEYNILKSQFDEYQKQQDKVQSGAESMIDIEEKKQMDGLRQARAASKNVFKNDPQGTIAAMADIKQAENRRTLRPKFSYGRIGFEEIDLDEEQAKKEDAELIRESRILDIQKKKSDLGRNTEKPSFSERDVLSEARAMAKEDYEDLPYVDKVRKYIPVARDMLSGNSGSNSVASKPSQKSAPKIDNKTEARIQRDMKHYGKTREEIIAAYKRKNIL